MTSITKPSKKRFWTVISCQCDILEEELCSWLLFQHGTLGIENKAIAGEKLLLLASFAKNNATTKNITKLRQELKTAGLIEPAKTLKASSLADQDWLSNWKKYFEPFHIGNSFLVCPPWSTKKLKKEDTAGPIKIIIEPGMAFGTGLHATTRFCLESIEKHLRGPNILDVGTGSGILSIASSIILSKANITAIDIDEHAIDNAKHNIALNNVGSKISLRKKSLESLDRANKSQFDTILSNMTAETIIEFMPIYSKILANDGILILAGIIEERLNLVTKSLAKSSFTIMKQQIDNGWVGLILSKKKTKKLSAINKRN